MSKDYHQFCGLAKAASLVGERWALLIVRDLSIGPRRFNDLHAGLPGIPTSLLTTRLRELEAADVVERQVAVAPARGTVYALTEYGAQLQPVLDALGRWGARRMREPESKDVITSSSLAAALRTAFRPGAIESRTVYQVHAGSASAWASVTSDDIEVGAGTPDGEPDLAIQAGSEIRLLLADQLSPEEALGSGAVEIVEGTRTGLRQFAETFRVPLDAVEPNSLTNE